MSSSTRWIVSYCRPTVLSACAAALCAAVVGCQAFSTGHNVEGVRQYQAGQFPAALSRFQQAIATDPENPDAYYNMAATYHRMGTVSGDRQQLDQAESLYNQCLDYNPDHVDCYRGLAVLLVETGRSDRAFDLLKNWAVRSPQLAAPRLELARLYEEFGDAETARVHLNEAVTIDPHDARAWAALGQLRERMGDYPQALANYERSIQLNSFQTGVAERIAALRLNGGGYAATSGAGTRTVQAGPAFGGY